MTSTLSEFSTTWYSRAGDFRGVSCGGDCGARCWQPEALASDAGRKPTLDEVAESVDTLMTSALDAVTGAHDADGYDAQARGNLAAAALAVEGAGWLARSVTRDPGQGFVDFATGAEQLLAAVRHYLGRRWNQEWDEGHSPDSDLYVTDAMREALQRTRALLAEAHHELVKAHGSSVPLLANHLDPDGAGGLGRIDLAPTSAAEVNH